MRELSQSPCLQTGNDAVRIPESIQRRMEEKIGVDLSHVRIHPNSLVATALGCRAFACGTNVHFAPGQYNPDTVRGVFLLGHELAHVGQQARGRVLNPYGPGLALVNDPELEAEADAVGSWLAGIPVTARTRAVERQSAQLSEPGACFAWAGTGSVVQMSPGHDDDDDDDDDDGKEVMEVGFKSLTTVVDGVHYGTTLLEGLGHLGVEALHVVSPVVQTVGNVALPISVFLALVEVGLSAKSLSSTYAHITKLKHLLEKYGDNSNHDTRAAVRFAIKKKNKKLRHKKVGCVPFGGSIVNSVVTVCRTLQKKSRGNKGDERRAHAQKLWENRRKDELAHRACKELLGGKMYDSLIAEDTGYLVLKKKMRSL